MTKQPADALPGVERRVAAADGFELTARLYAAEAADTVVLVNSATAVPQRFYRRFANYVQQAGWTAVTHDYRGIGESAPESLRGFEATMRDWAFLDMTAVVGWADGELTPKRLFAIGHSFGGQVAGMIDNARLIDAMVGVSAQSGYWGVQGVPGGLERWRVRFAVTFLMPALVRLFGYLPWSRLASGVDLPAGVALEWASWCRNPDYLLDVDTLPLERYRSFTAPVLSYSIEDDDWGQPRAVDDMMRAYPDVTRRHIKPADYGLSRLGHVGFFREGAEPIWAEVLEWLDARSPRRGQSAPQ